MTNNFPRPVFDRDQLFQTVRPLKCNGKQLGPGQPFDKSSVTVRRLRQLYDGRYLRMVGEDPEAVRPRHEGKPVNVVLGNKVAPPAKAERVRVRLSV